MKITVLITGVPLTGTDTSMRRIAHHLEACGHEVKIVRYADSDLPDLHEVIGGLGNADLAIGSHAFLGGRILRTIGLPYILVFGGTDLNEYVHTPAMAEMSAAVEGASALIAYNQDFMVRAAELWPAAANKLVKIPQGVGMLSSSNYSIHDALGISSSAGVFLLPAGLRRVKDVLYLADTIEDWRSEGADVHLAIVGIPREFDYAELVLERCQVSSALHLLEPLRPMDLYAAMISATAVLNTSTSECSPNSVLEAMRLGCPVLLRNIAGTRELVEHGITGLMFDRPDQFRKQAQRLLQNESLRTSLGLAAAEFVAVEHSVIAERNALFELINEPRLDQCGVHHVPGKPAGAEGDVRFDGVGVVG